MRKWRKRVDSRIVCNLTPQLTSHAYVNVEWINGSPADNDTNLYLWLRTTVTRRRHANSLDCLFDITTHRGIAVHTSCVCFAITRSFRQWPVQNAQNSFIRSSVPNINRARVDECTDRKLWVANLDSNCIVRLTLAFNHMPDQKTFHRTSEPTAFK